MIDHQMLALSTIAFTDEQLARLRAVSPRLRIEQRPARSAEDVVAALRELRETTVLYSRHDLPDWSAGQNLRWVQFHFAGVDSVDLERVPPNITITSASGVHSVVMAEHAFALILALRRHVPTMLTWQAKDEWAKNRWDQFAAPTLRGETLGVLGYGSIGREVARIGQCFGMTVLAFKRHPQQTAETGYQFPGVGDPDGSIPAEYFGPDRLYDFLARADVVANLLPATAATEKLMGASEFATMKPSALFLNLGRGTTVDQDALAEALREGRIAGAALDVFDPEPLPSDSPLWKIPSHRLIISPHVAGFFPGYDEETSRLWAENLRRFVAGEPLLNVVSRKAGY
ncbi:MAG: D-2-hydroxyacid dehydrogenase [Ardenticatenaceae bacterium]|nr:D-2-hydroxyacid dehydrogenase [Ardenticatenaceae bacterium]